MIRAGASYKQWNANELVVQVLSVLDVAALSERLSVIGGDDDDGLVQDAALFQLCEQPADGSVRICDSEIIGIDDLLPELSRDRLAPVE